jgi:hypothetical protein
MESVIYTQNTSHMGGINLTPSDTNPQFHILCYKEVLP